MDSCLTRVFIFLLFTFGIAFAIANTSSQPKKAPSLERFMTLH